jgi:two-component sensor histidine kinase
MREPSPSGAEAAAPGSTPQDDLQAAVDRERARAREIDHRAKNSLQLVTSLLVLAGRGVQQDETRQVLRSLQQRISALAAVHRGFVEGDGEHFDLTAFVREQTSALTRGARPGVALNLDLDPVHVPATAAAPLALIVNELTANVLIHAAAHGGPMNAVLRLQRLEPGFVLVVEDDGPGLPESAGETGLGLTLVRLMAKQIGAALALEPAQPGLRAPVTAG